ncbi:MAG: hypothetical protein LQ350_003304 [Teloschistes chrysophthalmus]|nr:MAG: hypothetical protein LQ350_003304 [Niorma chrysophthalma]
MSVWNPDNIKDVAESLGIASLNDDVLSGLSMDIECRIREVLEEALKFVRHSKRTNLTTQDISQALKVLNVEPLYGYESNRPLRFGEASIGPGQPLFYVEDEEVDFEKLINAPLPKVPREISFTAHWLAVEGVQPSILQNPAAADSRNQDLVPKGPSANPNLAAISGADNVTVKPLVKHVLSKELQLYFTNVCSAILDENNEEYRVAALSSIRTDPGLHQLVPYFVQFIAEKVTHSLKNLFILAQTMQLTSALLDNKSFYVDPYIASVVPPVLTCLVGRRLGSSPDPLSHLPLRNIAAALLGSICKKYGKSSHTLKPRLARTCLKHFLDPTKPLGANYGGIIGLQAVGGSEVVRALILPNVKEYESLLREPWLDESSPKHAEADAVLTALVAALQALEDDSLGLMNGHANVPDEEQRRRLEEKVGSLVAERVFLMNRPRFVRAILDA